MMRVLGVPRSNPSEDNKFSIKKGSSPNGNNKFNKRKRTLHLVHLTHLTLHIVHLYVFTFCVDLSFIVEGLNVII